MQGLGSRILKFFGLAGLGGFLLVVITIVIGGEYAVLKERAWKFYDSFDHHNKAATDLSRKATEALVAGRIDEGLRLHTAALGHYRTLHAAGYPEGTLGIGLAYCHGYGVEKRTDLGLRYLREAAGKNAAFAQFVNDERFCLGVAKPSTAKK